MSCPNQINKSYKRVKCQTEYKQAREKQLLLTATDNHQCKTYARMQYYVVLEFPWKSVNNLNFITKMPIPLSHEIYNDHVFQYQHDHISSWNCPVCILGFGKVAKYISLFVQKREEKQRRVEEGVPAWPEHRQSCGYSPPRFSPAPPVWMFLPPKGVTRCHVSAHTGYGRTTSLHRHTLPHHWPLNIHAHSGTLTCLHPTTKGVCSGSPSHIITTLSHSFSQSTGNAFRTQENKICQKGKITPLFFSLSRYSWQYPPT